MDNYPFYLKIQITKESAGLLFVDVSVLFVHSLGFGHHFQQFIKHRNYNCTVHF